MNRTPQARPQPSWTGRSASGPSLTGCSPGPSRSGKELCRRLVRGIRAAQLPFAFTGLCSGLAALSLQQTFLDFSAKNPVKAGTHLCFGLFWLSATLCSLADALWRVHEYRRIKYLLQTYGFRPRFFTSISRSRCQRDAMLQAARETDHDAEMKRFFDQQGYRWYHLLPDRIVLNPLTFFKPDFLRSTFWPRKRSSRPSRR